MKFTPKSDKEIQEERLVPEGEYPFEISAGYDKTSKAGNDMIELLIRIYKPDGNFLLLNDFLMEKVLYKISHACKACGLEDRYNSGELVGDDFVGKTGYCKVKIQKDKEGLYPDKNIITDYVVPGENKSASTTPAVKKMDPQSPNLGRELDDDIPF